MFSCVRATYDLCARAQLRGNIDSQYWYANTGLPIGLLVCQNDDNTDDEYDDNDDVYMG